TATPAASRLKSGESASPITVKSVSSTPAQRAPLGRAASDGLCGTKPVVRSLRFRTIDFAIACPLAVSDFFGSPSAPSAGAARASAKRESARTRTTQLYSRASADSFPDAGAAGSPLQGCTHATGEAGRLGVCGIRSARSGTDARRLARVVGQVLAEPALCRREVLALALGVVLDLVAPDPPDREVPRGRVPEVDPAHARTGGRRERLCQLEPGLV